MCTNSKSRVLASPSHQFDERSNKMDAQCKISVSDTASPRTQSPETALLSSPPSQQLDPCNQEHVHLVRSVLAISGERRTNQAHLPTSQAVQSLAPFGRREQYNQLIHCLTNSIKTMSSTSPSPGRSWYVSGLPGTGKSFTISRALEAMSLSHPIPSSGAPNDGRPCVLSVTVNCMALAGSKDVYAVLLDAW